MTITEVMLERFTAFESLHFRPSPGINVLIGTDGTGKTHLMKAAYAACDVSKTRVGFAEKLIRVFLPSGGTIGRLVKKQQGSSNCNVLVSRGRRQLQISFSNHAAEAASASVADARHWREEPVESVYIPAKEMLANAPGFRSLYARRNIHFEEIYADILDRAYLPVMRGSNPPERRKLLDILEKAIAGTVIAKDEEFFLSSDQCGLEFTLLAEGMRKLGLLWLLIQNSTLLEGSVMFWDEPETNLNPKLFEPTIKILLELQRMGIQIFVATHDYVILKELDLQKQESDKINFHALYRDRGEIVCRSTDAYSDIHSNAIAEAFTGLYDREIMRSLPKG